MIPKVHITVQQERQRRGGSQRETERETRNAYTDTGQRRLVTPSNVSTNNVWKGVFKLNSVY